MKANVSQIVALYGQIEEANLLDREMCSHSVQQGKEIEYIVLKFGCSSRWQFDNIPVVIQNCVDIGTASQGKLHLPMDQNAAIHFVTPNMV